MQATSSGEFPAITSMELRGVRGWRLRLERADRQVTALLAKHSITLLRVAIGLVYVWFGVLKFFPGTSPAEPLVHATMAQFVPMALFLPFLALWETFIGVSFIIGRWPRITIALMLLQMGGAMSSILFASDRLWVSFPFVWTLEGQYVFKDIILVSAALVIGATARGGRLHSRPDHK